MPPPTSRAERFRDARRRAGLAVADVAIRAGLSEAAVHDLEQFDDELASVYGPAELARLAAIVGVPPAELLGIAVDADPIGPAGLANAIRATCATRSMTVAAFEDACGWRVADALDQPWRFLQDFSIDGLRDVCRVADLPWEAVVGGLCGSPDDSARTESRARPADTARP